MEINYILVLHMFVFHIFLKVCVVAFLPHILDDQAAQRNERLEIIRGLIDTYKRKQWGWLWTESYAHPKLDETMGVSSYPSLIVVNPRKERF